MTASPRTPLILARVSTEGAAGTALRNGADGALLAAAPDVPRLLGPAAGRILSFAERLPDPAALPAGGNVPPAVLLVDTSPHRLLAVHSFAALKSFAEGASVAGFEVAFAGALEAPDVPRLLPLAPAFLAFDADELGTQERLTALRAPILPPEPSQPGAPLDLVFVRDLVLNMELGAYRSELGRRQRVRVTMEAEVAAAVGEATLSTVYSYDRMIDAANALLSRPHEAFVETLAEMLAAEILLDGRVAGVMVRLEKLDLGPGAAGIEIRRTRRATTLSN